MPVLTTDFSIKNDCIKKRQT